MLSTSSGPFDYFLLYCRDMKRILLHQLYNHAILGRPESFFFLFFAQSRRWNGPTTGSTDFYYDTRRRNSLLETLAVCLLFLSSLQIGR